MAFKYQELAADLQREITLGVYSQNLPTEAALVEKYHLSRQTVRQALERLVQLGLIEKRQGSGSKVVKSAFMPGRDRVAIVTTYINDYIFPTILQDIQDVLARKNYSTLLYATHNNLSEERSILQNLLQQPVAGIIVEGTKTALPNPNLELYEKLDRAGIPVVFIHGAYGALQNAVCVSDNNFEGGYMLTHHLITHGHKKIAGIFKCDDMQGHQRYLGFLTAMQDAGLPLADEQVLWYSTKEQQYLVECGHTDLLKHFLEFYVRDCTAAVCYNDEISDRLIRYMLSVGKRVPDDLAVVSFDNSYYSDLCPVRITSLAHEPHKMGQLVAALLLERIDGKAVNSQSISWRLIHKSSG